MHKRHAIQTRVPVRAVVWLLLLTALAVGFFFCIDAVSNRILFRLYPLSYEDLIRRCSDKYGLKPSFVFSVVRCESGFRSDAVSRAGAIGLMQIMPDTGMWIAEKQQWAGYSEESLLDPEMNVEAGCWYLRFLCDLFGDDLNLVSAAYNAGQGTVGRWLRDERYSRNGVLTNIPYPETAEYVSRVLSSMEQYELLYPGMT